MSETAERIRTELATLSESERAELARFLIESLNDAQADESDAVWDAELARRAKEIEAGAVQGEPAEQAIATLRAKYS